MDSHELAAWWIRTEAERIRRNPQPMNPDLLNAFLADVATGEMSWPHTTAALQAEEDGLVCDRCGRVVAGISRYPEGWLCDPCVAIVDGPEPDEDYADDVFVGWDASAELLEDMRREDQ